MTADTQQRIYDLEEFLYDDFGDTVEQLGMDRVRELEAELQALRNSL